LVFVLFLGMDLLFLGMNLLFFVFFCSGIFWERCFAILGWVFLGVWGFFVF
jgi:hypothetical protein